MRRFAPLLVWAGLLLRPLWAEELNPRLLAMARVPKGTLRCWVHGQYFGIDGLWDYNDHVESSEWCWWGPGRVAFQPLPRQEYIVRVDEFSLSAYYQDSKDSQKCHRWSPDRDGVYREHPCPYTRRYGSDVAREFLNKVLLPAYGQYYELFEGGLLLRRTGQPLDHPKILCKRRIQGVDRDDILVMQPRKHRILALGTSRHLLLLGPDLRTLAKLSLGEVKNLRFAMDGERLAVLTRDDRLWILDVSSSQPRVAELEPRIELAPEEFNRRAADWEKRTGRIWWSARRPISRPDTRQTYRQLPVENTSPRPGRRGITRICHRAQRPN